MTNKERFLELCSKIKREGIEDLVKWLETSDFFYAPASTKFHGSYAGGLLEHSLNVYDCLVKRMQHWEDVTYDDESIIISALFHDVAKINLYQKGTKNVKNSVTGKWETVEIYQIEEKFPCGDHADKSIIILQNFIKLKPEEIMAIAAHMGGWTSAVKGGSQFVSKIFETCQLAVHLHLADMEASYLVEKRGD
jgi:hypothetical protein